MFHHRAITTRTLLITTTTLLLFLLGASGACAQTTPPQGDERISEPGSSSSQEGICSHVIELGNDTAAGGQGLQVEGSLLDAHEKPEDFDTCSHVVQDEQDLLVKLYSVQGTGHRMVAAVAGSSHYIPAVDVFRGECSGGLLTCVVRDEDHRDSQQQQQQLWWSTPQVLYHIAVYGRRRGRDGGDIPDQPYTLSIRSLPAGDICQDMIHLGMITEETIVHGSTSDGKVFSSLETCSWYDWEEASSIIYAFTGRVGGVVLASLIGTDDDGFQPKMMIYRGSSCRSSLRCATLLSDTERGTVLQTQDQQTYFIAIHGRHGPTDVGDYVLLLNYAPAGDMCTAAIALDDNDAVTPSEGILSVMGDTKDGHYFPDEESCRWDSFYSQAQVYTVRGNGGYYRVSLYQRRHQDHNERLSIYQGSSCDDIECVEDVEYNYRGASWLTESDTLYYIMVNQCCDGFTTGTFAFGIESTPVDDACDSSTGPTLAIGKSVFRPKLGEYYPGLRDCTIDYETETIKSPVSVFTVVGSGKSLSVSAYASFQPRVSVMQNICGGSCVDGIRSSNDAVFTWQSTDLQTYDVLVYGPNTDSEGEFVVVLNLIEDSIEDSSICTTAVPLGEVPSDGRILFGTTESAVYLSGRQSCSYDGSDVTSPGLSFVLTGNGDFYTASVCEDGGFSTRLALYQGVCENLECLTTFDWEQCSYSWETSARVSYYAFMYGYSTQWTAYTLRLSSRGKGDACVDAISISNIPQGGLIISDSTDASGLQFDLTSCRFNRAVEAPGVLYSLNGTGRAFRVSFVSHEDHLDPQISLYKGSCGVLTCIEGVSRHDSISWISESDQTYFLLIHGYEPESNGRFEIRVDENAVGNFCHATDIGVIPLEGWQNSSSTQQGQYFVLNGCPDLTYEDPFQSRGVLYSVEGSGEALILSVRDLDGGYSSARFVVYEGSCGGFSCADTYYGSGELLLLQTAIQTTYFVLVYGEDTAFELSIEIAESGDLCQHNAKGILPDGFVEFGSTDDGSFFLDLDQCGYDEIASRAKAYYLNGTGSELIARAQTVDSSGSPSLSVFSGSCDQLVCISRYEYPKRWISEVGSTYYILVYGSGGINARGDFALTVDSIPIGEICDDFTRVDLPTDGPMLVRGTTRGASLYDSLESCSYYGGLGSPARVYEILGNGAVITVSNLKQHYSDLRFAVYEGSCSLLQCTTGEEYDHSFTWNTKEGVLYYLFVAGEAQDYSIRLDARVTGDVCGESKPIELLLDGSFAVFGSTMLGRLYSDVDSCDQFIGSPAEVYSVDGTGDVLTASTLQNGFAFETRLSVFEGPCDDLKCIGGGSSVTWISNPSISYILFVHGCCQPSDSGPFLLSITSSPYSLSGELCDDMISLQLNDGKAAATGSTGNGQFYTDIPSCNSAIDSPAVAYMFEGNGKTVVASTRYGYESDAKISVRQGSCDLLSCVDFAIPRNDENAVTLETQMGVKYFLIVSGCCDPSRREFVLKIDSETDGDVCMDAKNLDDVSVHGLLHYESLADAKAYDTPVDCQIQSWNPPSVYSVLFSVQGNGDLFAISVSSGDFSPRVQVFGGHCGNLTCVQQYGSDPWDSWGSPLIPTLETEKYFIFVHADSVSMVGDFSLLIDRKSSGDVCLDTVELGQLNSYPLVLKGNAGDGHFFADMDICSSDVSRSLSVLYRLTGDGSILTASVCKGSGSRADVYVFNGPCNDLRCVVGRSGCAATWEALAGEEYFVSIQDRERAAYPMQYLLVLTSAPKGDICRDAEEVIMDVPITMSGSTQGAPFFTDLRECPGRSSAPSMAYLIVGTGEMISVKVDDSDFDVQISVFVGSSCSELGCAETSREGSGASWQSLPGETYYVVVGGCCVPNVGNFVVHFRSYGLGNTCDNVITLGQVPIEGFTVGGSTESDGLVHDVENCHYPVESPALVYWVVGDGGLLLASFSRDVTTYLDAHLAIYTGDCEILECVDADYDYRSAVWKGHDGVEYFIYVFGCCHGFKTGDFEFSIVSFRFADTCDFVDLGNIPPEGHAISGSTIGLNTVYGLHPCTGETLESVGNLYSIVGTGFDVSARVSPLRRFDARIKVFHGSCESLNCTEVTGDDKRAIFLTQPGQRYFVLVYGCCDIQQVGEFELFLSETGKSSNATICSDAVELGPINGTVGLIKVGSTVSSEYFSGLMVDCVYEEIQSPVSVYEIVGNGEMITCQVTSLVENVRLVALDASNSSDCISLPCTDAWRRIDRSAFVSTKGRRYFVLVYFSSGQDATGDFVLHLGSVPFGNVCSNAISLGDIPDDGLYDRRSTSAGLFFTGLDGCSYYDVSYSRTVVYSIEGTGGLLRALVFSDAVTSLSIRSGDCDSSQCIDAEMDHSEGGVFWDTNLGSLYYILVYSIDNPFSANDYVLQVTKHGNRTGDVCHNMVDVGAPTGGSTFLHGSTAGADFYNVLPGINTRSMIYSVVGTGHIYESFVCQLGGGGWSANFEVMGGQCNNISMIETTMTDGRATWFAEAGSTYFVAIYSCCDESSTVEFLLHLYSSAPPPTSTISPTALPPATILPTSTMAPTPASTDSIPSPTPQSTTPPTTPAPTTSPMTLPPATLLPTTTMAPTPAPTDSIPSPTPQSTTPPTTPASTISSNVPFLELSLLVFYIEFLCMFILIE